MTLVCPDCFGDTGLKRRLVQIRPSLPEALCDFHPTKKGIPISYVAEIVDDVFRNRYCRGEYQPYEDIQHGDDLNGTLLDLVEADDDRVTSALANELMDKDSYWPPDGEEPFYDDDYYYVPNDYGFDDHSFTWRAFRREILHEQRFFNSKALEKLSDIFDGLHLLRDGANNPAVYELKVDDPNATFFRARISNSSDGRHSISQNPAKELGPPPDFLRRAGRMNSSGILAFYGAFDIDTCIAELRPAVGETVISAKFKLARPILVLDTTRFSGRPKDINIFAKTHIKRMRLWKFMSTFMNEIAQPCLPNDEHLDYVPTQVVSEYLRHLHKFRQGDNERTVDAIIYRSAQNGTGKNIAIFGDTGSVKDGAKSSEFPWQRGKPGLLVDSTSVECHLIRGVAHQKSDAFPATKESRIEIEDDELF